MNDIDDFMSVPGGPFVFNLLVDIGLLEAKEDLGA